MTCSGGGGCSAVTNFPKISLSEYGRVFGDENIMQEIYNRGPVACSINANCIKNYTAGDVNMYDDNGNGEYCHPYYFDHYIQLAGWGVEEDGTKYWLGRNSWGTYYGDRGFFKVVRGGNYNPLMCIWAVPDVPDF
jgi:cathepsin X